MKNAFAVREVREMPGATPTAPRILAETPARGIGVGGFIRGMRKTSGGRRADCPSGGSVFPVRSPSLVVRRSVGPLFSLNRNQSYGPWSGRWSVGPLVRFFSLDRSSWESRRFHGSPQRHLVLAEPHRTSGYRHTRTSRRVSNHPATSVIVCHNMY